MSDARIEVLETEVAELKRKLEEPSLSVHLQFEIDPKSQLLVANLTNDGFLPIILDKVYIVGPLSVAGKADEARIAFAPEFEKPWPLVPSEIRRYFLDVTWAETQMTKDVRDKWRFQVSMGGLILCSERIDNVIKFRVGT